MNKKKLLSIFILTSIFIFIHSIPQVHAIFKETKSLQVTLNITKPIYAITLNNDGADNSGTTTIYEKLDVGYYLNSAVTNQMTTFANQITIPEKTDYIFQGYYTEQNGSGTKYIDENGFLTSSADSSYFNNNGTLYAYYISDGNYLYNVIKKEAIRTDIEEKYRIGFLFSGNHQDSMDATKSNKNVYYLAGTNDNIDRVNNMRNVIFADQCWQMLRTTDTGGVRMIYNGEAENDQCLDTRSSHPGYNGITNTSITSQYYYGTDYTYDSSTKKFKLSGTTEKTAWDESTASSLIGKYTCKSTSSATATCSPLYYVESYSDSTHAYLATITNNAAYDTLGKLPFNNYADSPAYVGYMYNTVYPEISKDRYTKEQVYTNGYAINKSMWYSHSVTWGDPVADKYNLDSPYKVSSVDDLAGEYSFFNTTNQSKTDTKVNYIGVVKNSVAYYIQLENGQTIDELNYSYTYGSSITDNLDGTYRINTPTTIKRSQYYNYRNDMLNKYFCINAVDDSCTDPGYVTSVSLNNFKYSGRYKFSNTFSYINGEYILDDATSIYVDDIGSNANSTTYSGKRYTCWNTSGKCSTLSYVYYPTTIVRYIELNDGKSIEDALDEMLSANNVNVKNSSLKNGIDNWYKKYLYSFDNYIDDTIYCTDRTIDTYNSWDPNNYETINTTALEFNDILHHTVTDLRCTNLTDRYSVSNNAARLTYKIAPFSGKEYFMTSIYLRKSSIGYWLNSPSSFNNGIAKNNVSNSNTTYTATALTTSSGVRPVISLKKEVEYESGTGTKSSPYIIKYNLD